MSSSAKLTFIEQQGFRNPSGADGEIRYAALMFQPRLLGTLVLAGLIFGRFCLGSYVYHLFKGEAGFANRTLPWIRTQ